MLEKLQKQLNGIPVQNFFDLIVGTSTGGIVALGLGVRNLSVSDCIRDFKDLCGKAFTPRTFKRLCSSWYKTGPLKEGVQRVFGVNNLLFGGAFDPNSPRSHIKVAVTTGSKRGKSYKAMLLANYNVTGQEREQQKLDYEVVHSTPPEKEMKVWEAVLATSAAPRYFKPYIQPATGKSFIDGGLYYNCPALIVHQERQILWKDVRYRQPDIVLSIGTGMGREPEDAQATDRVVPPTISSWGDIINAFLGMVHNQLDTERAWADYYTRVAMTNSDEDRQRHIRLNVQFDGVRPGLDKVDQLGLLEDTARVSASADPKIRDAADRLVASSFYYEREGPVTKGRSSTGFILCRFDPSSTDTKRLGHLLLNRITGDFEPHFILLVEHQRQTYERIIPIRRQAWTEMGTSGRFQVPIEIPAKFHTGLVRIALALRPPPPHPSPKFDPYISIRGFPRELYDESIRRPTMPTNPLDGGAYPRRPGTSSTSRSVLSSLGRASTESSWSDSRRAVEGVIGKMLEHHRAKSDDL